MDLILSPQLDPYFEWDARRIFRHTGERKTRLYHEPWTGDVFWNIQVRNQCCNNYMFTNLVVLNRIIVVVWNPTWSTSILYHSLCGQDKTVLFWHSKRLPSDCPLCKSTCLHPKWQWYWWWACCWMAANCMFCGSECLHVLMFGLGTRSFRRH